MMAVANSIVIFPGWKERREQELSEARERFSPSAVALIGEDHPWGSTNGPVQKFRCSEQVTYFIGCVDHGIKIGISNSPLERLAILQTGSPVAIRILACAPGGRQREREYHNTFAEHRKHGEWFRPAPEILAEIDRLNAKARGPQ